MTRATDIAIVSDPNPYIYHDPAADDYELVEGKRRNAMKFFDGRLPEGARIIAHGTANNLIEEQSQQLAQATVLLILAGGWQVGDKLVRLWPYLHSLEWLAVLPAGVGPFLHPALIKSDVIMTNGKGTFSSVLAEYALTACLYFAKRIPELQAQQKQHKWEFLFVEELRGKTMGIVGAGDIGMATARLARAYGMKIVALRRRVELSAEESGADFQVLPPSKLHDLLNASDYVVNALPSTPETNGFISKDAISHMKPNAVIIHLGRGTQIDEAALIEALREKRIRGAALDTFEVEPLPEASPLWDLDNVLVSPHTACRTTNMLDTALGLFLANVERFQRGEQLHNIVDKNAGY